MDNNPQLPVLRQDLHLTALTNEPDGQRRWLLQDPVTQSFHRIGEAVVDLLPFFRGQLLSEALEAAGQALKRTVDTQEMLDIASFLRQHHLVWGDDQQKSYFEKQKQAKPTGIRWLLQHYLFIKLPLSNPDRWLSNHVTQVAWMGHYAVRIVICALLVWGVWLTVHQWDSFIASFAALKEAAGWWSLFFALVFVKILHELGHAFTAKYLGCKVPVIGLSFIVGWPILYTDTTDVWRIQNARSRLRVGLAGIWVELYVAVVALIAWHILPAGWLRDICFWLATTTWIMSVLVNFNPLMRFDGYYILTDAFQFPNLESRSQALARWQLREWLFGDNRTPPERPNKAVIWFAFFVWVYRFFLFLGIAVAVYLFFFKLLGLALFCVEIWYFIARPVMREMGRWKQEKHLMKWNRAKLRTLFILILLVAAFCIPWKTGVRSPALMAYESQRVTAPIGGQLLVLPSLGDIVSAGDTFAFIENADLRFRLENSVDYQEQLNWQLESQGLDARFLDNSPLVRAELSTQNERVKNLQSQLDVGQIRADINATVADINDDIQMHDWVSKGEHLLTLVDPSSVTIIAWVDESSLLLLSKGTHASFYQDDHPASPIPLMINSIAMHPISQLDRPEMAKRFGGRIDVLENEKGELKPLASLYEVSLAPADQRDISGVVQQGMVTFDVQPESALTRVYKKVLGIWYRESVF